MGELTIPDIKHSESTLSHYKGLVDLNVVAREHVMLAVWELFLKVTVVARK